MTKKKYPNLTQAEALSLAWKSRNDYKGYDRSKGSSFNSWRAIVYTLKGKRIGYPESWRDYNIFMKEVQGTWKKGKVCVRLDNTKPHSKENSYWGEKGFEKLGRLIKFEYKGETKTLLEWCKEYGLNYNGVRQRYFKGKNLTKEEILFGKKHLLEKRKITDVKLLDDYKKRLKIIKMLSAYRLRDKRKGYENNIDIEWGYKVLTTSKCFYCGDTENIGLDRIDNTKGHTKDNVVPCCYTCNTSRSTNFTHEEMKILGKTIAEIKKCRLKNQNSNKNME